MIKDIDIFNKLNEIAFLYMNNDPFHDVDIDKEYITENGCVSFLYAVRKDASFIINKNEYDFDKLKQKEFNKFLTDKKFKCFIIKVNEFIGAYPYGIIESL